MSQINFTLGKAKTLVTDITITGVAAGASNIISVTAAGHGLETGDIVQISGVTGSVEANGQWVVTKGSSSVFTLQNSLFITTYVSGGTAKHIGYAVASGAVDNSVTAFTTTVPSPITLKARIEGCTSNVRVVFEDATEAAFVTAQPMAVFQTVSGLGANASAPLATLPYNDKTFTAKLEDNPDARYGASGNAFRMKVYISGGAGKKATFSGWIEY